ncbi:hypothetical protein LOT_2137 [Lentilactobacillus otakiensis DSM 19908 = JCM 15040]|uniref:Uncharacterized protein n=1 Tax=Lentilactobacillus otakiensis DSM 19908 = JCM 15040 TaxID=1423780 RepID=S4NF32_9LACO|nr:hypothetical protein LOT_2137 [Lentilactobacillus otakiensis DSM 19908 = JCM 15040]
MNRVWSMIKLPWQGHKNHLMLKRPAAAFFAVVGLLFWIFN